MRMAAKPFCLATLRWMSLRSGSVILSVLSIALSSALPNRLLMSITSIKSSAVPSATQVN